MNTKKKHVILVKILLFLSIVITIGVYSCGGGFSGDSVNANDLGPSIFGPPKDSLGLH